MSDESTKNDPAELETKSKVTKVIKMGGSTLLVIDLGADADVAEGEYQLEQITVRPPDDEPSGATGCTIQVSCSGQCACRTKKAPPPKKLEG